MTIINRNHSFIYLKSHKTAGTSTEFYLITQTDLGSDVYRTSADIKKLGFPRKRRDREFVFANKKSVSGEDAGHRNKISKYFGLASSTRRIKEHMGGCSVRELVGEGVFDHSTVVTNIRNPWDALVSSYHWKKKDKNSGDRKKSVSFSEYLEGALQVKSNGLSFAQQYLFYPYLSGKGWSVDQVIVFEDLASSIDSLLNTLGVRHPGFRGSGLVEKSMGRDGDYRVWYTDASAERVQAHFAWFLERFPYEYDSPGVPPVGADQAANMASI